MSHGARAPWVLLLVIGACAPPAGCGGGSSKGRSASATQQGKGAGTSSAGKPTTGGSSSSQTAPSRETSPGVVSASAQGVTATMHASTNKPRVNAAWPVSFTVKRDGRPAKAEVRYQYLFAGQVVARRSHYRFRGTFHDVFNWPASAVGYPLTFRAVIGAAGVTLNLDYAVQVQR
jgi:hypothetical protein